MKARVAELYLPLLSLARDTLPRLHDFAGQWARAGGGYMIQGFIDHTSSGQKRWGSRVRNKSMGRGFKCVVVGSQASH